MTTTGATQHTILLVDDDPHVLAMLRTLFCDQYTVHTASSGSEAIEAVRANSTLAAVVLDIKMPGVDGLDTFRQIAKFAPALPVIFHTGYPGEYDEEEIDAQLQPFDYIQKGMSVNRLERSVRNACESAALRRAQPGLVEWARTEWGIIGRSKPMQEIYRLIERVGPTDAKVIILGESGTGKELVARALHLRSSRHAKPLFILECNHKNPDLIESQLFGHLKGAFTSADRTMPGLFEDADGSTIFLDEIGDLDITTQAKILRVIERGEYAPIGASAHRRTNVRVICATNKNLGDLVERGAFRHDLYYRLQEMQVSMPPLRERREDIPALVACCAEAFSIENGRPPRQFEPAAMNLLIEQDWRAGNVRDLFNTVRRCLIFSDSPLVTAADVHQALLQPNHASTSDDRTLSARLREFTRTCIIEALAETDGNIAAAARILGKDRANLWRLMRDLGIEPPSKNLTKYQ